eukprot:1319411-Pyramimonas_sp.AAC.1
MFYPQLQSAAARAGVTLAAPDQVGGGGKWVPNPAQALAEAAPNVSSAGAEAAGAEGGAEEGGQKKAPRRYTAMNFAQPAQP